MGRPKGQTRSGRPALRVLRPRDQRRTVLALKEEPTEPTATCPGWVFRQACRVCGCSYFDPCEEGCWWVESDLCSACVT